jgi:ribA/ribD-fused uncharacterized protein
MADDFNFNCSFWFVTCTIKMMKCIPAKIDRFAGPWAVLSNFYTCPVGEYASSEHKFQAFKFPPDKRQIFTVAYNPNLTAFQAKRLGRTMKGMNPDWENIKVSVMRGILIEKFYPTILRRKLLSTMTAELIEGNYWHDTEWGVCYGGLPEGFEGRKCKEWPHEPRGKNLLGILLMEVREYFR